MAIHIECLLSTEYIRMSLVQQWWTKLPVLNQILLLRFTNFWTSYTSKLSSTELKMQLLLNISMEEGWELHYCFTNGNFTFLFIASFGGKRVQIHLYHFYDNINCVILCLTSRLIMKFIWRKFCVSLFYTCWMLLQVWNLISIWWCNLWSQNPVPFVLAV